MGASGGLQKRLFLLTTGMCLADMFYFERRQAHKPDFLAGITSGPPAQNETLCLQQPSYRARDRLSIVDKYGNVWGTLCGGFFFFFLCMQGAMWKCGAPQRVACAPPFVIM